MKNPSGSKIKYLLSGILMLSNLGTCFCSSGLSSQHLNPTQDVNAEKRDKYDRAYRERQLPHPCWIWRANPKTSENSTFVKEFTINEVPAGAVLTAALDGTLDVYINGKLVVENVEITSVNRAFASFGKERSFNDYRAESWDVSSFLKTGVNVIEIRATRRGREAGLMAFLNTVSPKGVPLRVVTDETWTTDGGKYAASLGGIGSLTYRWPIFGIPYENHPLLDYLRVWPVEPETARQMGLGSEVKIEQSENLLAVDGRGTTVMIPDAVKKMAVSPEMIRELEKRRWPSTPIAGHPQNIKDADPLLELKKAAPALMFDFGRVVHGRLQIASASDVPVQVLVNLGESAGEAELLPNLGTQWRTIPPKSTIEMPESAFRFAKIWFIHSSGNSPAAIDGIKLDYVHYPVTYLGSFHSSDPLLERIWETGLHTAHLNMQDAIWDGPKRDRGSWAECVYYVSMASHYVFADRFLIEHSLDFHRQQIGNPPSRPSNGYVGHTARFLLGVASHYRFSGDKTFLNSYADYLIPLVDFMKNRFFEEGKWLFTNPNSDGLHIDCVEPYVSKTNQCNQIGVHMMLFESFKEGAWLLRQLNDPAATTKAKEVDGWLAEMKKAADQAWWDPGAGIYGQNIQAAVQANALAIASGLAGPEQARAIYKNLLQGPWRTDRRIAPYGMTYVLDALMALPNPETAAALEKMHAYYGPLLERGFTSFPETDLVHGTKPAEVPGIGLDWHRRHDRYSNSLAHGTSGTQPAFLGRTILGVWPSEAGFAECEIKPNLGNLEWAEGSVPTPRGLIKLRHEKKNGCFVSKIELPDGVKARISLPILEGKLPQLELNGRRVESGRPVGTRVVYTW